MLGRPLPFDVDVIKVDIPAGATSETPWRLTRLSRCPYFVPVLRRAETGEQAITVDYAPLVQTMHTGPDSDIYAVAVDRVVSVTPLSFDLTSRADFGELESALRGAGPFADR